MELKDMELKDIDEKIVISKPKVFIWACVGIVAFVSLIACAVFFLSVRGAEQTMVPDVRGKDLVQALLELQQKELYPRIQLRYSNSVTEKGKILEQDPRGGTIVKAGRRIRMVVSQGAQVSAVGNYVNRDIESVRADLTALFAGSTPLITIKEPLLYQFSTQIEGTILEQNPPPGTDIFSPVEVDLVVSKGKPQTASTMPALTGLKIGEAMTSINKTGIRWKFDIDTADSTAKNAGTVISQHPAAGEKIESGSIAQITVAIPKDIGETEVFRVFKYTLPENPYPLTTKLEVILPSGDRRLLTEVKHSGGDFTFPCRVPADSTLVLSVLDREMRKEIFTKKQI
ncbi:PASTA domain-containing protein [Spirochaetia bacterium]|nr:PASTA domain-containing protein [Spirochaetia bacterium]